VQRRSRNDVDHAGITGLAIFNRRNGLLDGRWGDGGRFACCAATGEQLGAWAREFLLTRPARIRYGRTAHPQGCREVNHGQTGHRHHVGGG